MSIGEKGDRVERPAKTPAPVKPKDRWGGDVIVCVGGVDGDLYNSGVAEEWGLCGLRVGMEGEAGGDSGAVAAGGEVDGLGFRAGVGLCAVAEGGELFFQIGEEEGEGSGI